MSLNSVVHLFVVVWSGGYIHHFDGQCHCCHMLVHQILPGKQEAFERKAVSLAKLDGVPKISLSMKFVDPSNVFSLALTKL